MPELILHHYELSPFAEKIRTVLGYKGLAWRSVEIPVVMPKPDLTALTGGYRKTPVLQIGADVYCDTLRIARALDERYPVRPVFGAGDGLALVAGRWLDQQLFLATISLMFDPEAAAASTIRMGGADAAERFAADRGPMMRAARVRPPRLADARVIVADTLVRLEAQTAAGGPFLGGDAPRWADFCAFHPLWALARNTVLGRLLDPHPALTAWLARMRAFGHGESRPLDAGEAIAVARETPPADGHGEPGPPAEGVTLGDAVEVAAADWALESSAGTLAHLGPDEVVVRRVDARAGEVAVHFPRIGYTVRAARAAT